MIQYVFHKPIPMAELEAELRFFARLAANDGYDTISHMVVVVQPTLCGEPFELIRRGSDVPVTRISLESRFAAPPPRKSLSKPTAPPYRNDGDD